MNDDAVRFWRPSPESATRFLAAYLESGVGAPHVHEEWQFAVAEHPAAVSIGAFRHHAVGPGDVTVIPPYVVHAELGRAGLGARWHVLHVAASEVARISDGLTRGPSRPASRSRGPILPDPDAATELLALLQNGERSGDFPIRAVEWIRRLFQCHELEWPAPSSPTAVERARTFARDRPTQLITLGDVVAVAGVSVSHLVRTFSRVVGLPPMSYYAQIRLARARRLLSEGNSATWVAYECGFADQSHLGRRFKESYGITPSVFQMQASSDAASPRAAADGQIAEIGAHAA